MDKLYANLISERVTHLRSQPDIVDYYKNKYVLITGGNGFIGRHVRDMLTELGAMPLCPKRATYNLTNQLDTYGLFSRYHPVHLVMHLAAGWMGIGRTSANPAKSFYDNLQMGLNVIDTCQLFENTKVLVAGSVCAYPEYAPVPYREHNLWMGKPEPTNGPYGVAKRVLGTMLEAYADQYKMPAVYPLLGNTYGPYDNFDLETSHVIPALIRKFIEARTHGKPEVEIWGDGNVTRSFCFVTDIAAGLIMAGARLDKPEPFNLGSADEMYISWLVNRVKALTGYTGTVVYNASKPSGQKRRSLCIDKAQDLIGWEPFVGIEAGLSATYQWYMEGKK